MKTIREIEDAIQTLSPEELAEFRSWFTRYVDGRFRNQSALEVLSECPSGILFKSAEEMDAYIRSERNSWNDETSA